MRRVAIFLAFILVSALCAAEIPRLASAPVIDGKPGDPGWNNALKLPFSARKGFALFGRTATCLYAAIQAEHGSMTDKKCIHTQQDETVYDDDNLDFFFNLSNGGQDYGQIIANVNGAIFDHLKDKNGKAFLNWDSGAKAKGSYGDNSFYIELCVPLASLAPPAGKIGIVISAYSRWNLKGTSVLGRTHHPESFTYFDVEPFPVQCLAAQWPVFSGDQTARFELKNISKERLRLTGSMDGRKVAFDLAPEQTRTVEIPLHQQPKKVCFHTLKLFHRSRLVLQLNRTLTPRPVLEAILRSDLLYPDEKIPLQVKINEKQNAPLEIECGTNSVRCSYKGNTVELPFQRISSPWSEKR